MCEVHCTADSSVSPDRVDTKELVRKPNHKQPEVTNTVPCTPSKNLFSPGLRTDAHVVGGKKSEVNRDNSDSSQYDSLISTGSCSDDESDKVDQRSVAVEAVQEVKKGKEEPEEEPEEEEESLEDVFNPYSFIAGLPSHDTVKVRGKICLPTHPTPSHNRTTLVLDLDETLVHCTVEPISKPDLVFPVA